MRILPVEKPPLPTVVIELTDNDLLSIEAAMYHDDGTACVVWRPFFDLCKEMGLTPHRGPGRILNYNK